MASPTLTWQRGVASARSAHAAAENPVWSFAKLVVSCLASLKITVTLLAMGIFIIFVGTLAQAEMDMWDVMKHYFRTWVCMVPVDVFFPPAWFQGGYLSKSFGFTDNRFPDAVAFPFPGGATIGVGLFINLAAAYLWHFRVQAKTAKQWISGLALLALGLGISLAVVWSGHNSHGEQAEPLLSWAAMWAGFQSLLVLGLVVLAGVAIVLPKDRRAERFSALVGAGLLFLLLAALYFSGASLTVNPSSVRILWQIGKGVFAGLVLLSAGLILYRKRGGVVTMHFGVAMLMFGEFFVSYYNNEEQMSIEEGRTVNYAYDIRTIELAFIDPSAAADVDHVAAIPQSRLRVGEWITDEALPCDVKIEEYISSSQLENRAAGDSVPQDFRGLAREAKIEKSSGAAGADVGGKVNLASAFVKLRSKGGESLGTYLLTQVLDKHAETVKLGDTTYQLALRFQRNYKPYHAELVKTQRENYLGTDTPRDYSSDVRFVDDSRGVDFTKHIWMNNPLRYAGETFYQSGHYRDPKTGRQYSTLQVVTNRGWMIPYLACGVVMVGMLAQFLMTLYRFLLRYVFPPNPAAAVASEGALAGGNASVISEAMRKPAKSKSAKPKPTQGPLQPVKTSSPWVAVALCGLCALWVSWSAYQRPSPEAEMNLVGFGAQPVVHEGRAKPFDALARNILKSISKSEVYTDLDGHRQPAIRWLLEVISGSSEPEKYKIFRVEDPDVREMLGLEMRFGQRYSLNEIRPKFDELDRQAKLAMEADEKKLERHQKKLLDLYRKLQMFVALKQGHQLADRDIKTPFDQATELMSLARIQQELPRKNLPLAVPTHDPDDPWEPLGPAASRVYVQALAIKHQAATPAELARKLVGTKPPPEMLASLVQSGMIDQVIEIVRMQNPSASDEANRQRARLAVEKMPAEMRSHLEQDVRERIFTNWGQMNERVEAEIGAILGAEKIGAEPNPVAVSLTKLLQAYKNNEIGDFNSELDRYAGAIAETAPADTNLSLVRFEQWYNKFMPCYTADVLYVIAFVLVCFSWLILSPSVNRASFWILVLAFSIHTFAILARIFISGRPPVTNLYSSAVFIGWALVLMNIVLERLFPLGFASALGGIGGFLTLTIAHYLAIDGDTFTVMQAVLDTQFWLSTHVVCITLGYTATFAAGFLGIAYILAGVLSPVLSKHVRTFESMYSNANLPDSVRILPVGRLLATMIYGVLCFALFFSLVGTVLGGLWADDSWGRFWGWDPKENGALIIVIWNVIIMHCRWDKMVRDRGLAVLAVVGNIVTSWSWFGVNELGIGLHSYGFTEGRLLFLGLFVLSQLTLVAVGLLPRSLWRSFRDGKSSDEPLTAEVA